MEKEGSGMMTGNADPCGRTALPGADAVPTAPHILIAEDHPAIQELLCSVLQLAGYRTTACAGRQAALTWIDRTLPSGDCPALILLDLSTGGRKCVPGYAAADFTSCSRRGASLCSSFSTV